MCPMENACPACTEYLVRFYTLKIIGFWLTTACLSIYSHSLLHGDVVPDRQPWEGIRSPTNHPDVVHSHLIHGLTYTTARFRDMT